MSCEYQLIARFEGVNKFIDAGKGDRIENEPDVSRKTLQSFKIAISPTGEIVVFAKATWLLICGSKWDPLVTSGAKIKYSPNWHGHINCKPGEEITAVLCLPFFSQGHSTHGSPDWTCIVLGFSSGHIRFYTEGMQELACSILHEERITYVKCFHPAVAQEGKLQKQDSTDIYILYKSVICVVNKSQLYQALRNKRSQLAKGVLNRENETEGYLSLDFKKYSFVSQEEVIDACFLGQGVVSSFNTFDHLVTASLVGGFNSHYRASPPQTSLIVASGRRPFVGFHFTLEGSASPALTDVALAVASKIKNSVTATLPDWFGFGSKKASHSDKPREVSHDYAERLSCRFGLCDLWRQGQSVIVSPDGMYSAVTDSLGRVTLIDNASGVAHRMWKGCRDAQCGFLQVAEDGRKVRKDKGDHCKPQPRTGLFVVVYAPKKGLVEIFTAQNGRRVASFKVSKFGHLLYAPGASGANVCSGGFNLSQSQVIFVSEEGLSEFSVPFHCALAEDNSRISRDLHVLKKIKMVLKTESNGDRARFLEELRKYAAELKTDEIRLQTIESMITYRNVTLDAFKVTLTVFVEALQSKDRTEPPPKKITAFAEATLNLLLFHDFLLGLSAPQTNTETTSQPIDPESLSDLLKLPRNELDAILKVIFQMSEIERSKQQSARVAFEEQKSVKLAQVLSCFDFENFLGSLDKMEKQETSQNPPKSFLNLRSTGKEQNLSFLGELFFKGLFHSFSSFDGWKNHLQKCCFNPEDLALCLLSYWCSKDSPVNALNEITVFVEVLKAICALNGPNTVAAEYNAESGWWKQLRGFLAGNPFTIRCLLAAVCCRSVTVFFEQERELSSKGEKKTAKTVEGSSLNEALALNNDWETLSKDSCQWDILLMQLQDVALLNAVLSLTFPAESKVTEVPFDFERQCLTSVQAKGTGSVSELVAKWLAQFGFEPSALIDPADIEFQLTGEGKEEVDKEEPDLSFEIGRANERRSSREDTNFALSYLALLKTRFPYSLTSSSLLGNMCWEYFAHWFKNVSDIQYLESAVRYLQAVPSGRIKYGISYLSWNTYLEHKFHTLAKITNRIGKVPTDKLCLQEIGLRNDQVPSFLQSATEVLATMLHADLDRHTDFGTNREVLWQNTSSPTSSLVLIALAQPLLAPDAILLPLQLTLVLLMLASLNLKQTKLLSSLFHGLDRSSFTLTGTPPPTSHHHNGQLKASRTEFLKKCLTAAVQSVHVVENVPPGASPGDLHVVPTTRLEVDEYKKWLQICFDLAAMWAVAGDELRRHQICELYLWGFDRLAEEVIPSVDETAVLGSQLLVIGGKRLKYLIHDSKDLAKKLVKLSANLGEWLQTLDLESFTYQGPVDDIEVLMRFIAKWLPEGHSDHKLAVEVIESLQFLKIKST